MNGTEQSDSLIVPRKSANKAARAAAEPMEGSGGTKRNAELQSTARTQSRAAVSQAQGRIREAVCQCRLNFLHLCRSKIPQVRRSAIGRRADRLLVILADVRGEAARLVRLRV